MMIRMIKYQTLRDALDELFPDAQCELNYNKDYELLIAVALSAQTTDARVNMVTKELFSNNDIRSLVHIDTKELENILRPIGTYTKKAIYVKEIAKSLVDNYDGIVPNNREYLESLKGVGHKTANVVLSNLFDIPAIAVDTHVSRVSKRLGLTKDSDTVEIIESKLMKFIPKNKWSRSHHQLVLFGRYHCKAIKPECSNCPLKEDCKYNKIKNSTNS